jgi:hypothetical protein
MNAVVQVQVDQLCRAGSRSKSCLSHGTDTSHDGEHHPVVDGIGMPVQHTRAFDTARRLFDRIHYVRALAFAEVWDALDDGAYHLA